MTDKGAWMRGAALGALMAVGLVAPAQAATDPTSTQALIDKVEALTRQVEALQARLDAQPKAPPAPAAEPQRTTVVVADAGAPTPPAPAQAQAAKPSLAAATAVSGRMYYNLSHIALDSNGSRIAPSGTGFDVKRLYIGIDHRFSDVYSANVITDVQYSSALGSNHLFVKKAYLQASYSEALNLRLGSADLPWIPFVEELYGYRYVEQTITDRTRFGTSADWGVHAYGKLGPHLSYALAVVDGGGFRAPLRSKLMDVEGRVSARLGDVTLAVGGYTGKLDKDSVGAPNVLHTASRFNAVAAYVHGPARVGVEYFAAKAWNNVTTLATDKSEGVSAFASYQITPHLAAFGRYDWEKPKETTAPAFQDRYFNVGLQYEPVKVVDFSLVYKHDRVVNGVLNTGNGLIGGIVDGVYDEVGMFGQFRW